MAISPALFAQEASGGITGKVTDPSGAAVVGANVTARDVDRGTVWTTKTNDGGVYNFARLPIGRYEVKVEATGFQTAVRTAFALELNQTARVDLALTLGQVSQQVEVTDAAPVLQTADHRGQHRDGSQRDRQPAAGDAQLQPADAADSGRGHHQSRVFQHRPEDLQRRRGPTSTAIASRPITTCWTAWRTSSSSITMWPTRRTWTRSRNSA